MKNGKKLQTYLEFLHIFVIRIKTLCEQFSRRLHKKLNETKLNKDLVPRSFYSSHTQSFCFDMLIVSQTKFLILIKVNNTQSWLNIFQL